ncbi:phosphoadenylyl-sulfate reductase [Paracoccus jiaweipingae]|uniref:phosphoadenylyl-sulfate reductase n=1 Tax=Paracoccus sp. p2-l61 TaxID=3366950 RepID=UPI0037A21FCF
MESWPIGGEDPVLSQLQETYFPDLSSLNIKGLLADAALGDIAIVSSFGADSIALLHYMSEIRPGLPVLFIDTGKHFDETLRYVDEVTERLGLVLRHVRPSAQVLEDEDPQGTMWRDHPDGCCRIRKVMPLQDALEGVDSWVSGRKRFQASTRATIPIIERDGRMIKINPMALWTQDDIDAYMARYDLPRHPLVARGYPSIGCATCTSPVADGADPRSGRWAHSPEKTECGIHLGPDGRFRRG